MEDCLFCKIINGEIPSQKIYEDENILAFNDINPVAPVHVLIIPKKHIKNINEIDETNIKYISSIYLSIKKIANICNVDKSGYRVICNTGDDGGQVVHHIHFHLLGGKKLGSKLANE